MEKTKHRIEILCIIALLVIMLPSADYLIKKAFADVSITIITPTGGALGATSDCTDISSGNGIIWHGCNGVLYAIEDVNNTVSGSLTVATISTGDLFLASISGTSVYVLDDGTDLRKYTYSGGVVTLSGILNHGSCTEGNDLQYDHAGFLWVVCSSEDRVQRINPNTFSTTFLSQALDDNLGIDCDNPQRIAYANEVNIGVIRCGTAPQGIVTFSIASSTSATLLDDELAANLGNNAVFIHNQSPTFRIYTVDSTEVESYPFDSVTGVIGAQSQVFTTTAPDCHTEPFVTSSHFFMCVNDSGANTQINAYLANATGLFEVLNTLQGLDSENGIGFDIQDRVWYIVGSLNDQRYIKITGLASLNVTPTPPEEEDDPNIIGGVDCSLPENEFKLICRVTDPIGGAGNFVIGNGTSGLTGIGCSIGIVDCSDDTNPRTNGLGLLIFVGSIFVVVAMFYLTIGRDAFVIPVYIWIVIILALSAFFTITGLIDPIFLILTVVGLIALAVPQIQKRFFSSGMGGGSTA